MKEMPLDDRGFHELVLAAHEVRDRFCYHYWQDGVERIGSPAIHVYPGETFAIRIANDIGAPSPGERLAASKLESCMPPMRMASMYAPVDHYVGYLNHIIDDRYMKLSDADTNLHLHGFQGAAQQDDPFESTLSTPMRACEYVFTIPLTQEPGTYFYHPHAHGASDDQVAGGLGGAWIVDPPAPQLSSADQHLLVLGYAYPFRNDYAYPENVGPLYIASISHLVAQKAGEPVSYHPFAPPDWPTFAPMRTSAAAFNANGCDGAISDASLAIDGAPTPATMTVDADRTQALNILNATADSAKTLSLVDGSGATVPMRVAELDGRPVGGSRSAPLSSFLTLNQLMLASSGRATILVNVPAGDTLTLREDHFCEGLYDFYQPEKELLAIHGVPSSEPASTFTASELAPGASPADSLVAWVNAHRSQVHRRAITYTDYALPRNGKTPAHFANFITDTTDPHFHEHPYVPQCTARTAT
jgi:FtsP/CotA-like multicopper oxidase with cupredoxin domain